MTEKNQKQPKIKKHYFRNILSTILLIIAIGALFYPIVANYLASKQTVSTVQNYNQTVSKLGKSKAQKLINDAKLYNAKLYNEYIYDASQGIPWKGTLPNYNQQLNVGMNGMMGYISIPQINVESLPIYHGDAETTLELGAGHIPQTSLPIGGINTHTVIAAHSGHVNNTLFTNLDELKIGDVFYLHTLELEMKYKVDNIKVVNPDQVNTLGVVKGKDLATLITCYPTGINNKRLLVTGERVPLGKVSAQEKINRNQFGYNFWVFLGSASLALLGLLYLLLLLLLKRRRLYQIGIEQLKTPKLTDQSYQTGDFGQGFYLTSSKKIAKKWAVKFDENEAEEKVINVYRLKRKNKISYREFKAKSENWKTYVDSHHGAGYDGKEYDLTIGPLFDEAFRPFKRPLQYVVKSDKALEHLKYVKTIKIKKD